MKTHLALLFAAAHATHAAGPTIPQRPPPDAFQKLTEDWPFALATPVVVAAEPVKSWAANYYVGGIMKNYESGKEEFVVAVKSRDGQAAFSLTGSQPNADDISVGGIELSEKILESRVTLKKGSEFATIKFDEAFSGRTTGAEGHREECGLQLRELRARRAQPGHALGCARRVELDAIELAGVGHG